MVQLVVIGICNWILINVTKCNTKYRFVKLWIVPAFSNLTYHIILLMAPFSTEIDLNLLKGNAQFLLDITLIYNWLPNGRETNHVYILIASR